MDPFRVAAALVRHRRIVITAGVAPLVVALVLCFVLPKHFTASFVVMSPEGPTGALGMMGIGRYDSGVQGWLIPKIIGGDAFLFDVGRREFPTWTDGRLESIGISVEAGAGSRPAVVEAARDRVKVRVDALGGVVRLRVTTTSRELSFRVAEYILEKLESSLDGMRLDLDATRKSHYADRLAEVEASAAVIDGRFEAFLRRNRGWRTSRDPEVMLALDRFRRWGEVLTDEYIDLVRRREFDALRLAALVPSLQVLDPPARPRLKSFPRRKLILLSGGALGMLLGPCCAGAGEWHRRRRRRGRGTTRNL